MIYDQKFFMIWGSVFISVLAMPKLIFHLIMICEEDDYDDDCENGDNYDDKDDDEIQGQCTFWRYLTGSCCNCNRYR